MGFLEILVIVIAVAIVGAVLGTYLYRKSKGLPTGQCVECRKATKRLLKEYHAQNKKK